MLGPVGFEGSVACARPRLGAKAAGLLAWVALAPPGDGVPRRRLTELLWGERDAGDPGGALRQCLHQIRRALPAVAAEALLADAERVAIDGRRLRVDVTEFERDVREAHPTALLRAAGAWRGDLLDAVVTGAEEFDRLLDLERTRLRGLAARVLARLVERPLPPDALECVLAFGHRLIGADPLREAAYRDLIRLYQRHGRATDAERVYSVCRRALARELQLAPTPETVAARRSAGADLGLTLTPADRSAAADHVMYGRQLAMHMNAGPMRSARAAFETALALDPGSAAAAGGIGWTHWFDWVGRWSAAPEDSHAQARAFAERALRNDALYANAWLLMGKVLLWERRHDEALAHLQRGVELDPSWGFAQFQLGDGLTMAGRPEEALEALYRSLRLSPSDAGSTTTMAAIALFIAGDLDAALQRADSATVRNPGYAWAWMIRATVLAELGRTGEAAAAVTRLRELNPALDCRYVLESIPYRRRGDALRQAGALQRAGLP
jgi:DNA-binding SARP family transcriptional activator